MAGSDLNPDILLGTYFAAKQGISLKVRDKESRTFLYDMMTTLEEVRKLMRRSSSTQLKVLPDEKCAQK